MFRVCSLITPDCVECDGWLKQHSKMQHLCAVTCYEVTATHSSTQQYVIVITSDQET